MEKKTTYRILGVLAVIALAISLLPIFVTKSSTSETTVVKAPPFPDEATQVPSATAEDEERSPLANQPLNANPSSNEQIPPQVNNEPAKSADTTPTEEPKDLFSVNRPSVVSDKIVEPDVKNKTINITEDDVKSTSTRSNDDEANTNAKTSINKSTHATKLTHAKSVPHEPNIGDIKKAVWVIQMGSFKNKTNALRLVNRLRANGYHAFMKKTPGIIGDSTRVFVGPEKKKASAHALASRLNNDVHIKGIVISYKPLEL